METPYDRWTGVSPSRQRNRVESCLFAAKNDLRCGGVDRLRSPDDPWLAWRSRERSVAQVLGQFWGGKKPLRFAIRCKGGAANKRLSLPLHPHFYSRVAGDIRAAATAAILNAESARSL